MIKLLYLVTPLFHFDTTSTRGCEVTKASDINVFPEHRVQIPLDILTDDEQGRLFETNTTGKYKQPSCQYLLNES